MEKYDKQTEVNNQLKGEVMKLKKLLMSEINRREQGQTKHIVGVSEKLGATPKINMSAAIHWAKTASIKSVLVTVKQKERLCKLKTEENINYTRFTLR